MKEIWVDFNAITEDGYVRLDTQGSIRDLESFKPEHNETVWFVDDGELRCQGRVIYGAVDEPDLGAIIENTYQYWVLNDWVEY
jgi:hypothetical protein